MAPSSSGAVLKLQYPHRFAQNGTCTYNPTSLASGADSDRIDDEDGEDDEDREDDEDGLSATRKCVFGSAEPGRISLRPPSVNPTSWTPLQQREGRRPTQRSTVYSSRVATSAASVDRRPRTSR